jgi:hypothetical protein
MGQITVATDSIAAYIMGNDPEAETLQLPSGGVCDNYLYLLNQVGIGTNKMSEIEIVGDGADLITVVNPEYNSITPISFQLSQNYPNPFNPATNIQFTIPRDYLVTLAFYNSLGEEVTVLINRRWNAGLHAVSWNAVGMPSGIYLYKISAGDYSEIKKMALLK